MKRLAIASAVVAVVVGMGACARDDSPDVARGPSASSPSTTSASTDTLGLCRRALPGREGVSATPTTVGDLRTRGYGGPVQKHPLGNVFPASAPGEPAAWCWTRQAVDSYTAWGVHVPDAAERAITVIGPTDVVPAGRPVIP